MDVQAIEAALEHLGELPGIGVDVEAVERFAEPDPRLLTSDELAYCAAQDAPAESRAGRWCAKEAVVKACAKHLQLSPREVEILVEPCGRPIVALPERAAMVGLVSEVSISHAAGVAIAVAIAAICEP